MNYKNKKSWVIRLFLVGTDIKKLSYKRKFNKTIFLYFGRIFYYKGVDILIDAVNILSQKRDDFTVIVAGESDSWNVEYEPKIKNKKNLELIIRYIKKDELTELFSKADYFIAPYREITQSGPLLRAYNFDIIPITSNENGFLEYVKNNENGFVFESGSAIDLARVMEKAIMISPSEKNIILSNISKMKSYEFDINNITSKYLNMFSEIHTANH